MSGSWRWLRWSASPRARQSVASTGAIEESREVALAYARNARACLNGELQHDELESLTDSVVNRER